VTYADAVAFCDWLTATSDRSSHFRLPTESEWEYACRAGGSGAWPFGQTASMLEVYAWCRSNAGETDGLVRPVATRSPNAFGLYDMLGNVEELCVAASSSPDVTPELVLKGGNIAGGPLYVRPAARNPTHPAASDGGFRVVVERQDCQRRS
jgi:formylglycine-generating enzyme required for sulfatase activity